MNGAKRAFAVAVAAVVGLGALRLLLSRGGAPDARRPASSGVARPADRPPRGPDGAGAAPSVSPSQIDPAATRPSEPEAVRPAAPRPRPEDGPEADAWRASRVAFRPRDLGRLGAGVKVALDDARRDMEFCFRDAARASSGAADAPAGPGAARPSPAILLLYLQAREGALDVVDTGVDYLGDATPELVECCREVLHGLEIPVFGAVPGQRFRLKFPLE